jgi:hypothetical protein
MGSEYQLERPNHYEGDAFLNAYQEKKSVGPGALSRPLPRHWVTCSQATPTVNHETMMINNTNMQSLHIESIVMIMTDNIRCATLNTIDVETTDGSYTVESSAE